MRAKPNKAAHARHATALLAFAAQAAGAQSYWYAFDACGFNSNGWQPSPQAATQQAKQRFDAARVATQFCPPMGQSWQTAEVEPVELGSDSWGFKFRITNYAIDIFIQGDYWRCDPRPPHVGEWFPCITMNRGIVLDRYFGPPRDCCSDAGGAPAFGNPIHPMTGRKTQAIRLATLGGFDLDALYDTTWKLPNSTQSSIELAMPPYAFGPQWGSTLHRRLVFHRSADGALRLVQAMRGGARMESFQLDNGGVATAASDTRDQLRQISLSTWRYLDTEANTVEIYASDGRLLTLQSMTGAGRLDFSYSDGVTNLGTAPLAGLMTRAIDGFGRGLFFEYELATPNTARVKRIVRNDSKVIALSYDSGGNLKTVTREDGRSITLLYERPDLPWALTGMIDEDATRVSRYEFDSGGLAMVTGRADGNGGFSVDRYTVSYAQPPRWIVEEPVYDAQANVLWRNHRFVMPSGVTVNTPQGVVGLEMSSLGARGRVTSRSQGVGSGAGPSSSATAYDDDGLIRSRDDFNGTRTCYARESRGFEMVRVEGLAGGTVCASVTADGAALPAGSSKTSTRWHQQARVPVQVAEPGRIIHHVYHGQPDTSQPSQPTASCAPANATLADGNWMALLCKQVTLTTLDGNGAAGFAAALDATTLAQTFAWTYNAKGQILTASGPIEGGTSFDYHAITTADHAAGDLASVSNVAGHATQFIRYDAVGQLLESRDANGVATTYAYDDRRRLTSITVAGQVRRLSYWGTGQLHRVTEADDTFVEYRYDGAQRLTSVVHSDGRYVEYTLDAGGRRVAERAFDPGGVLRAQVTRVFDTLGREERRTGRELQP